jgi:cytochrome c-type biogenesis protein CcmE
MDNLPKLAVARVVLGLGLAAAGCASVGIGVTSAGDIRRNPASFEGKEVTVRGTVNEVTKLPMVEHKSYTVLDATGEIRVTTRGAAPAKGERVVVRGVVSSTAIVGGHSLGLHVSERQRSAAY